MNETKFLRRVLILTACILSLNSLPVFADVIKNGSPHFKTIGTVSSFQYLPAYDTDASHPTNPFFYDIFYYIPTSLKSQSNVSAIIFNHGGGSSTMDRAGSIHAVGLYMPDLKKMADQLGIIVVLPSANGLNWGVHTIYLMRDLAAMMRKELDIDSQHLGLSGHSMGGMGITRSYSMLADEFAFFLPMSAGMDLTYAPDNVTEWQINKVFNVPYIHLEGLSDSFDIFVTRCKEQLRRTQELEVRYGLKSKLNMVFYDAGHNYNFDVFKQYLNQALQTPRDLYQPELFGTISTNDSWFTENNITHHLGSVLRYFWVEARDVTISTAESFNFHAKVTGNNINIDLDKIPTQTKKLRIYLHSKMVDLTKPVTILINQKVAATRDPAEHQIHLQSMDQTDSQFVFEDFMDVAIGGVTGSATLPYLSNKY